jgi:hypothetical protein
MVQVLHPNAICTIDKSVLVSIHDGHSTPFANGVQDRIIVVVEVESHHDILKIILISDDGSIMAESVTLLNLNQEAPVAFRNMEMSSAGAGAV